jgi:hypothetical protein
MQIERDVDGAPTQRVETGEACCDLAPCGGEVEAGARPRVEERELERVLGVVRPLVEDELRIEAGHAPHREVLALGNLSYLKDI